jgi:hypothetical protein
MGDRRDAYMVLVGRSEGKRPLERPRCRWEDDIKMDLQGMGWGGMNWIDVTQDSGSWWVLVNVVLNLRVA